MKDTEHTWNGLREEQRKEAVKAIIAYFQDERSEEIGLIAAEALLDFFLQDIGGHIYNKALDDSLAVFRKGCDGLEFELGLLRKSDS